MNAILCNNNSSLTEDEIFKKAEQIIENNYEINYGKNPKKKHKKWLVLLISIIILLVILAILSTIFALLNINNTKILKII